MSYESEEERLWRTIRRHQTEIATLSEQLLVEKMRNRTVESVMLFLIVVLGLYAVFV